MFYRLVHRCLIFYLIVVFDIFLLNDDRLLSDSINNLGFDISELVHIFNHVDFIILFVDILSSYVIDQKNVKKKKKKFLQTFLFVSFPTQTHLIKLHSHTHTHIYSRVPTNKFLLPLLLLLLLLLSHFHLHLRLRFKRSLQGTYIFLSSSLIFSFVQLSL